MSYHNRYYASVKKTAVRFKVFFYRSDAGREPVRDWLKSLTREERKIIGEDIKTVQFGWPVGMPVVRALGHELYEIRSNLENKIVRVLFSIDKNAMILLHAFIKKDPKIPMKDLMLARKRLSKIKAIKSGD
jgi:phage-related protein